ncbi:YARHG domain-containing protein [Sphingobacterium spiritivorum]|uniref:YARHG domain-containing protein n=1 Tax=Sphingobacterium spiritivorum TaxID=258 RepID=UPI003DA4878E
MKNLLILFLIAFSQYAAAQTLKDCSTCATELIKADQIKELSVDEIRYLTNDLFARKGYVFQSSEIDSYYSDKSWYKPVNANSTLEYNKIENQNIKLFQDRTKALLAERAQLIAELKKLKSLVMSKNKMVFQNQFGYKTEDNNDYILNVVDEIFLDDIHWFKNEGLYKVSKDNGDIIKEYTLQIVGNTVTFSFSLRGFSDIGNGNTIYPTTFSPESSYLYVFRFAQGKLRFDKVIVAG